MDGGGGGVIGPYLDIFLQRLKLCVKTCLTGTLCDPLFQLLQLLLLPQLVSDLYVFPLLIEPERPSSPLSGGPFEAFIIRGRCGPRRVRIGGIRRRRYDCGHRWRGGGISGVSLVISIRISSHEQMRHLLTLIEANFGCIGLYLSFLDCGAGIEVSKSSGCAAIFKPTPC